MVGISLHSPSSRSLIHVDLEAELSLQQFVSLFLLSPSYQLAQGPSRIPLARAELLACSWRLDEILGVHLLYKWRKVVFFAIFSALSHGSKAGTRPDEKLRFLFGRPWSPPSLSWVFACGEEVSAITTSSFLLSAAPPSHPASIQEMSVLEGGMSVPELWYFSVGTSCLFGTSSRSLIALPSPSSRCWPRK